MTHPRFHCPVPMAVGDEVSLPPGAARHVQVLRLQPGRRLTLFSGEGGEFEAEVLQMGRSEVAVRVLQHHAVEREAIRPVHLAVGLMANERMDWLVEKATELGAASLQPLLAERSVLRLSGERAAKRLAHWQAVAVAACEQCGRNRVPPVLALRRVEDWVAQVQPQAQRWLLSLDARASVPDMAGSAEPVVLLSGPEGGLSAAEETAALAAGFCRVTLGPRILRAETAPLAALSRLT